MQKTLLFKIFIIVVLTVLIAIPLMMIQNTISERMQFHAEAVRSIGADSVREQTMIGPILVIPTTETYEETVLVDAVSQKTKVVKHTVDGRRYVFPNDLSINGRIDTDQRYRGIHKVLVYSSQHTIAGNFVLPKAEDFKPQNANGSVALGKPFIAFSIDDVRGIGNIPTVQWGDKQYEFQQGTNLNALRSGLHASLEPLDLKNPDPVKFSFNLGLNGIERLSIAPVAKNNQVTLSSSWQHPQFGGRFLPSPKKNNAKTNGFERSWSISALSASTQQQIRLLEQKPVALDAAAVNTPLNSEIETFNVSLIEPVNIYSQADRAVKYGLLFVALTFAAFFLFEVLKQLPIHPIQYTLVGLALVLFFLLLLSLSERIDFMLAYLIASGACIVLIGFYLSHVLRDWKRGFGFGFGLTVLYGVLFGLLQSENQALMMGSILLFVVLSAVMIATRKVDWYQLGKANTTGGNWDGNLAE